MSEYKQIKGILSRIKRDPNEDDKSYFERVTNTKFKNSFSYSLYQNDLIDKFINSDDILYKFIEYIELHEEEFINIEKLKNGDLKFHVGFYNGSTCLSKMLEDVLELDNERIKRIEC